jgi:hypothetical protein
MMMTENLEIVGHGRGSVMVRMADGQSPVIDSLLSSAGVKSVVALGRDCDGCGLFDLILEFGTNARSAMRAIGGNNG